MRKITFFLILLISFNCKSQDIIEYNKLTINTINVLNENKSVLTSNFGEPNQIITEYSEMDEQNMYIYEYFGMKAYVIDDIIESVEINNDIYSITSDNIKVGNNILSLKNLYPNSYKFRSNDFLKMNVKDSDMFLLVQFNNLENITKISLNNY